MGAWDLARLCVTSRRSCICSGPICICNLSVTSDTGWSLWAHLNRAAGGFTTTPVESSGTLVGPLVGCLVNDFQVSFCLEIYSMVLFIDSAFPIGDRSFSLTSKFYLPCFIDWVVHLFVSLNVLWATLSGSPLQIWESNALNLLFSLLHTFDRMLQFLFWVYLQLLI